ncbi:MAG TPA: NIPSNAP family protein [Dissulfurispiraceae bacterium]|nr:NIPSNAP family protein [Dissulfurispiraceae bacterium]
MLHQSDKNSSIYQLRIYEVSSDKRAQFHERFEKHALRIMQRYNFKPVILWESVSVSNFEFIYILEWPNIETMEQQWKAFLADSEWIEIKRIMAEETGEPVQRITSRVLESVKYSPAFHLSMTTHSSNNAWNVVEPVD